jgi:hypothetical protein
MKLYYSPGACSLSPHIALHEAGLAFTAIPAPTKTHKLPDGTDYYSINPLGYVPLLELDDGTRLTEGPAIVQYIADQAPDKKLAPPYGTIARYKLMSWLTFIGTEVHKNFGPLFNPATPDAYKEIAKAQIAKRLGPLVVSCGTQQSESMVVVEPGGHVGRLPLSLSTCPRGGCQEHGFERWSGGAVHQRVGPAATLGG